MYLLRKDMIPIGSRCSYGHSRRRERGAAIVYVSVCV